MARRSKNNQQSPNPNLRLQHCFVVEGETEAAYVKTVLGASSYSPQNPPIIGVDNPPCTHFEGLLDAAKYHVGDSKFSYPTVYMVLDGDVLDPNQRRIQLPPGIIPIITNPCFEYVLRLHFDPESHSPAKDDYGDNCLKSFGYPDHKAANGNRQKLVDAIKANPSMWQEAKKRLKRQDKTMFEGNNPLWHQRLGGQHSPNSNFHEVMPDNP
jgi:hypothetical protein